MQYIFVFIGGMVGALLRYLISFLNDGTAFPIGTLIANLVGAILMGYLSTIVIQYFKDHPILKKGLTTGFLGALTTFSTFQLELVKMFHHHSFTLLFIYALVSYIVGIIVCGIGVKLGGRSK
ncbi:fluoride efflux transporter CrcB [Staphylococcus sp. NRL 16/872]|uniref:fluoride efflux transporter CrcB n=1 Tax=Staphylococcus sp. NRL 16/872 TaxID=2930131 RepID=UPI001FB52E0E|nr:MULTISPECIES: fluoride efflux transporter CrcB [unclassified Staphylococcus]MCJ1656075.1 fluoride efflux transporter CrcB [Staphylococcus sp. NRL 21/187]MCJ1661860.1 fluoride efflux transporter CrcB [Staphylococcus sp. NRL 18/288]MCJ1667889.1 fluoride efflux transporter CrcB [Staphylococcus sp. NRL 19/737]WEN70379.1 fluoride efflux transporter CrcB [Staphylococcus sp. NRL 16/872]